MILAAEILSYIDTIVFCVLTLVAILDWYTHRGRVRGWIVLTFGSLATFMLADVFVDRTSFIAERGTIALLLLFPWLMYNFTAFFAPRRFWLSRITDILTGSLIFITFALPPVPDYTPAWYVPYLFAIVFQWIVLLGISIYYLQSARAGQPTLIRRRLTLLVSGAVGLVIAIIALGLGEGTAASVTVLNIIAQVLAGISAILFHIGFFTPKWLQIAWRNPEQEVLHDDIAELLSIDTVEELQQTMLPQMAHLVAAQAIVLIDHNGEIVASYGVSDNDALQAAQRFVDPEERARKRIALARGRAYKNRPILPIDLDFGILLVWINPYLPFLGNDEINLIRSLGTTFSLAAERLNLLKAQTKRADQLAQIAQLKDQFVAMASHELRTPLASILGFSQTLLEMPERLTPEQRAEFLEIIHTQGLRLQRLIEDMLTLSKIESGALKIEPECIDVAKAAEEAAHSLSFNELEIDIQDLSVKVDPHHLHQMLVNYLVNAQRYGNGPYRVIAEPVAQEDGQSAFSIIVEDAGEGVPEEFVPRLFERFSQASKDHASGAGTGLGLSIVREMAQAHGGDAWYEARPGGGSRFGLILPMDQQESEAANPV